MHNARRLAPEEFHDLIEELLRIHERDPALSVRGRDARRIFALGGLELEVIDTVQAALVLLNTPQHAAATPLARKAFEFSVVAQWIHTLGNDVEAYLARSDLHWKGVDDSLAAAGMSAPSAVRYLPKGVTAPPAAATLRRFEQVCQCFLGGESLYLLYRLVSGPCHPSMAATARWLAPHPDGKAIAGFQAPPADDHILDLYLMATSLVWVGTAVDQYVKTHPRKGPLKAQARRLGIEPQLTPTPTAAERAAVGNGRAGAPPAGEN